MKLTKFPTEVDEPQTFLEDIQALRNGALAAGRMDYAVSLSHIHAWMHWLGENLPLIRTEMEIKK